MSDGTGNGPSEPPTTVITSTEPPTTPMTPAESADGPAPAPETESVRAEAPTDGDGQATGEDSTGTRPVWPGLSAAGLPTRVPQTGDDEQIKEAFFRSWEAAPTGPTPLTKAPFVPTFPAQPSRRSSWSTDPEPAAPTPTAAEPPEPKEPPEPAEPPQPRQPPAPPSPPAPPTPPAPTPPGPPGPTPFPTPTPAPTPPEPVPAPPPPGPVPVPPPAPPVPTPPPPFPTPPGPVPPPPSIVPGRTAAAGPRAGALYPSGTYGELRTEPITGVTTRGQEVSGTLAGHLATRGEELFRRRERRRKVRTALWVTGTLLVFATGIVIVVNMLAGDFIRSLFDTLANWAG